VNAFVTGLFVKGYGLAGFQGLVAVHLHRREVRKQVVTAAILDDESVPFGIVEPLDLASWHDELPCSFAVSIIVDSLFAYRCRRTVGPNPVTQSLHGFTLFYNAT
jgi:hypothetical protein